MDWSKVPLILIIAALLIGGLVEPLGTNPNSEAMISVGFFMLGSWTTIEIQTWYQRLKRSWLKDEPLRQQFIERPEPAPYEGEQHGL